MSELEPDDSRDVTGSTHTAPGEPPRTGPREDEARAAAGQPRQEEAAQGLATEGDSPEHPDRFSGAAATGEQSEQEGPNQNGDGDRWHQQAQRAADD